MQFTDFLQKLSKQNWKDNIASNYLRSGENLLIKEQQERLVFLREQFKIEKKEKRD